MGEYSERLLSTIRLSAVLSFLSAIALVSMACGSQVEVTREVPVTVETTNEVLATVEVTRQVPVTVQVTREIPITVEVTRQAPVAVEVTRQIPTTEPEQNGRAISGSRLNMVRDRGTLICASRDDLPGWGYRDSSGRFIGFDIDLCRAVATAVLGDPDAIEIRSITAAERGPTLQSGEVDLLVRTFTWITSRDALWGNFVQTMFYDGQGFLVRKELGIANAMELGGITVCVLSATTTELNLHEFSDKHRLDMQVLPFEWTREALESYESRECEAITNDHSQLALLASFLDNPAAHIILPEVISEEPLGPALPHGDDQWFDIVKTVMAILIYGEVYGITSDSVPVQPTGLPSVDRFLGYEGSYLQDVLGLNRTVAQDVIKAVGNYGEIYSRNLDSGGIHIPREGSRNALWADAPCEDCPKGGQIYAVPLR